MYISCDPKAPEPTTSALICSLPRFRILVIGKSGVGKTTLIGKAFKVPEFSYTLKAGSSVDVELTCSSNDRFVLHEWTGETESFSTLETFIEHRRRMPLLKDRIHAIWLCIATPPTGVLVLEKNDEDFLKLELGGIPIVVVFTKYDLLLSRVERLLGHSDKELIRVKAEKLFNRGCSTTVGKIMRDMDRNYPHVKVTIHDKVALEQLVHTTLNAAGPNNPKLLPPNFVSARQLLLNPTALVRLAGAMAHQVGSDSKIQASIEIGALEYWRDISLEQHTSRLVAIHADIIRVWSFNDPEEHLSNQMLGFRHKIFSGIQDLLCSHNPVMAMLMGYIIDLTLIMKNIHLALEVGVHVTPKLIDEALTTYHGGAYKQVHQEILAYTCNNPGLAIYGTDATLEKLIQLIRTYHSWVPYTGPDVTPSLPYVKPHLSLSNRAARIGQAMASQYRRYLSLWVTSKQLDPVPRKSPYIQGSLLSPTPVSAFKLSLSLEDSSTVDFLEGGKSFKGGFCDIFQGIHQPSRLIVAMRCPRVTGTDEDRHHTLSCFYQEARIWSTFDHINILPLYGIIDLKGSDYMISPWMANGDLSRFLKEHSQNPQGMDGLASSIFGSFNKAKIICGIAAGLAYLHSMDYVHGDINARNVLLAADGTAQLCDFGLTKVVGSSTSPAYKGAGSVRWMAPELFDGSPKTLATDVFAFSMTIVEVLTGQIPYSEMSDAGAMMAISKKMRPVPPLLVQQGYDFTPFWKVASHCWKSKPENRLSMQKALAKLIVIYG